MLPFMSFLIALMVALGVIGATMSGRYPLTVVAAVTLLLTLAVGAWTMTRRHKV